MYLILSPADIFYLTGVMIHDVGEVMILMQMQNEKCKMQNEGIVLCDPRTSGLFDASRFEIIETQEGWRDKLAQYQEISTDPDFLTQSLCDQIEKYGVVLHMSPSPITQKRMIKTPEEIEKLRASQAINRAVFDAIQPYLHVGVTEETIARRIQILQLELGASGPSFPPIVAF